MAHPPLGKAMIAVGEWLFGLTPFGWRFAVAVVGTLSILMTARIARRMTRSTLLGCVAGLLMALDGLEFVLSRTAILDIIVMFWVLAAFGMLVLDRDASRSRLAALTEHAPAGEMAGAIAHEVNQPLTAVANYGRSAQELLERGRGGSAQLEEIVRKILAEADRASEVVRRLRDFFRAGTTRLEAVALEDLLGSVRRIAQSAIAGKSIALEVESAASLPALYIDRLQIEMVFRKLLAN